MTEKLSKIDQFAELLSEHIIPAHAKPGQVPKKGGNVAVCAAKMGKDAKYGNAVLQKIRRGLGPQAV